jgi:FAD/FMN-containing dehydrogenase
MSSSPVIGPNLEEHHRSVTLQSTPAITFDQLRADIRGTVIAPDDAGYDEARTVVSGEFDRRPSVIVRVADVHDVAHVVKMARDTRTQLAVRSGGHSGAGHSTTDGGIVLDLRGHEGA